MDNNMNPQNGHLNLTLSILLGLFTWFAQNVDLTVRLLVGLTSSAAAIAAFINYIYSIKEKRKKLRERNKK